jgi:ferredoxin
VIARRAGIPVEQAAHLQEGMEEKGLVFAYHRREQPPQYMSTGFIVGFFEFQLEKLNPELVADLEEYNPTWFDLDTWKEVPQIRTVPVGESIPVQQDVLPYEQAAELVDMHRKFAVANCVCQQERLVAGEVCAKPSERCLSFGASADYIVRNGMGRFITQGEVMDILEQADHAGLVLQPANGRKAAFICTCCGCCCGVLRNLKRHPQPASVVSSPFYAILDVDLCDGCGTCETRCQMEAIALENGYAALDLDRCIGCGLCVTTCPNKALSLERKPAAQLPHIPKDLTDTTIRLGKARGKLNNADLVKLLVKSKVDRLLAAK